MSIVKNSRNFGDGIAEYFEDPKEYINQLGRVKAFVIKSCDLATLVEAVKSSCWRYSPLAGSLSSLGQTLERTITIFAKLQDWGFCRDDFIIALRLAILNPKIVKLVPIRVSVLDKIKDLLFDASASYVVEGRSRGAYLATSLLGVGFVRILKYMGLDLEDGDITSDDW